MSNLTDDEIKILSLVEQRFWETGYVASDDKIAEDLKLSIQKVKNAWKKSNFREALIARGVDLDPTATEGVLTPTQVVLANMLLNTHDKSTVRQKLEACHITSQQYNAWMRQPAFSGYLRKRAEKAFQSSDHVAYITLMRAIEEGDVNATMKFFEMRNIYNPKIQVEVNVEQVIVHLVEIVARHVTDPHILQLIANDVEKLELGRSAGFLGVDGSNSSVVREPIEVESEVQVPQLSMNF